MALLAKRNDPLHYFDVKTKKKLLLHEESTKKLAELTGQISDKKSFRSQICELLNKTNERVQLDRPFLIREKMQVIMIDSEKPPPDQTSPKVIAGEFLNRNFNKEKPHQKKYSQQEARGFNLIKVGRMESDKDLNDDS